MSYFFDTNVFIEGNKKLREPQKEAYIKIKEYMNENEHGEALVVLPTGTGKSGLISIAPYNVSKGRVLVITPGLVTKKSVVKSLHPMEDNFWLHSDVIFSPEDMPVVEEYSQDMLDSSLEACNFVITNIQKLNKDNKNSLINRGIVTPDFFDMIIVDEAHHAPAATWKAVLKYFRNAKKLYVTGTPYRGDNEKVPGKLIHETKLSEVMALKYVKWLRKETVSNSKLYFTMVNDSKRYTKEEILELKDSEWISKAVALSDECSKEVVEESVKKLKELRNISPNVPHKILAVGCSIKHAEAIMMLYQKYNLRTIIVHSKMEQGQLEEQFLKIDNHQCDVVVSVNMLMEGYDHKYLTILSMFRPYRSLNAFAQVVGRVLRAIPDCEINDYAIDNNAIIIYHEDIGLDKMWQSFLKEIKKSKNIPTIEHKFKERDYVERKVEYGTIETDEGFISGKDSYLKDLDFNKMYEEARLNITSMVNNKRKEYEEKGLDKDEIDILLKNFEKKQVNTEKNEVDKLLLEKRPELARKQIREFMNKNVNELVQEILLEKGIDPKSNSLYYKFKHQIFNLKSNTNNDGILVRYINTKISKKFGPVNQRKPDILYLSQQYMQEVVNDLRRMI